MSSEDKKAGKAAATAGRNIKQMIQDSPKSTVKVAPVDKDRDKDTYSELKRFKEEMKSLITGLSNTLTGKITELDVKFTGMFEGYQKEMQSLRKDVNDARTEVIEVNEKTKKVSDKVDDIERGLEFQMTDLSELKDKQKENLQQTREYIDDKVREISQKLLLMEKQDRKYNLLVYGIPEEAE